MDFFHDDNQSNHEGIINIRTHCRRDYVLASYGHVRPGRLFMHLAHIVQVMLIRGGVSFECLPSLVGGKRWVGRPHPARHGEGAGGTRTL
ncbi:hypothetical protein MLD38_026578 [Melastoma candidum]|uniref:Uncharacterized protein n=1 Tax=Melastoma candidum TaxID=119954 RepID=A0ACB9NYT2_9MYRT|nr:hypothetical protein MLD38_026578 [Melastoma candidum]